MVSRAASANGCLCVAQRQTMAPLLGQPEDKPVPDQTPTVISIPRHFRPHEAEDVDAISPAIRRSLKTGLRKWTESNIHKARAISQKLGRKLRDESLDLHEPLNTLEGRELTFPEDWSGADRREMARAGFYYGGTGDVRCFACRVCFRDLNYPGKCPWQQHAELAPNCPQLIRYQSGGYRPTPAAKRQRYNSSSAAMQMTSE